MLQKFNITTYAVALCLFGFMLFTAAPVFADPQDEFDNCKAMKWSEGKKDKKNCFQNLAEMLLVCADIGLRDERGASVKLMDCMNKI